MRIILSTIIMAISLHSFAQADIPNKFDKLQEACENAFELLKIWKKIQEFEIAKFDKMANENNLSALKAMIKNREKLISKYQSNQNLCLLHPDTYPSNGLIRKTLQALNLNVREMLPQLLLEHDDPYEIKDRTKIVTDTYDEFMGIPVQKEEPCCSM